MLKEQDVRRRDVCEAEALGRGPFTYTYTHTYTYIITSI